MKARFLDLTRQERRLVTAGVMVGIFLGAMESTVVATAMPTVVASLGGLEVYSWVFSSYLLTSTVTVPLWGKLSDLYGRRRFYLFGIGLFLLGSVACGFSQTMTQLICFRGVQGLGAGAVLPLGLTIIGDIYPLEARARIQGLFSGVWGVASIAGPFLGGLLTDYFSWQWVFFVNVPVGIIASIIIGRFLREPESDRSNSGGVDFLGATVLILALVFLLLGVMETGWTGQARLSLLVGAIVGLVVFGQIERRVEDPIIPLGLFGNRMFLASFVTGLLAGMAMFGAITFIPLFVQAIRGTDATGAGSVLTPFMLAWVSCSVLGARLLLRHRIRAIVLTGGVALTVGFLLFLRLGIASTQGEVMVGMTLGGAGMGLIMAPLLIAVQNTVSRDQLGVATSVTMFSRTVGGAIGVGLLGAVMTWILRRELVSLVAQTTSVKLRALVENPEVLLQPAVRAELPPFLLTGLREALAHALHGAFLVGFVVALLALISVFLLPEGFARDHILSDGTPISRGK
ncbi:MAG: MDR family MFS transporter [Candidatus Methylomirabilales bacterium]